jgi:hypothetical protein
LGDAEVWIVSTKISKNRRAHLLRVVERIEFPMRTFDGTCTSITIGGVPIRMTNVSYGEDHSRDKRGTYSIDCRAIVFRMSTPGGPVAGLKDVLP